MNIQMLNECFNKTYSIKESDELVTVDKTKSDNALIERGLTKAEKQNRMMANIFERDKARNERMAKFLRQNGVSFDEVESLKSNTGLHGNALHKKMIELGIDKEFFNLENNVVESMKKINKFLSRLNEAEMSPEDKRESDLLRNVYAKINKRANAKLTPEEKSVIDKYGIELATNRPAGSRDLIKGQTNLTNNKRDSWDRTSKNYYYSKPNSYGYKGPGSNKGISTGANLSKINLVDRARKADERDSRGLQSGTAWDNSTKSYKQTPYRTSDYYYSGDEGHNSGRSRWGKSSRQAVERDTYNRNLKTNYNTMQNHLDTRKDNDRQMSNAKKNLDNRNAVDNAYYDTKIKNIQKELDFAKKSKQNSLNYNQKQYEDETVGALRRRNDAQTEIDKMLKKKTTNESLRRHLTSRKFK